MIWYLSFSKTADEGGWQGFCLVDVEGTEIEAIQEAHRRGINPGGEVLTMNDPSGEINVPDEWMNKLFTTKEDAEAFDKAMGGEGEAVSVKS